jgi:hypothetical protein
VCERKRELLRLDTPCSLVLHERNTPPPHQTPKKERKKERITLGTTYHLRILLADATLAFKSITIPPFLRKLRAPSINSLSIFPGE